METPNNNNSSDENKNPQDRVMGLPSFTPKEEKKPIITERPISEAAKRIPQIPSSGTGLWFFFGFVLFMFIVLIVASVYMLQTEGGVRLFESMGASGTNARIALRNIINGVYIFFSLILVVMLMIGAGILATSQPTAPSRKRGMHFMIFSITFIFLLLVSYVSIFPILYSGASSSGTQTSDLAKYIAVTPSPPSGSAPLRVFFDASQIDQVNNDLFYEWDFGDESDPGTGPKTSHEYTKPGIYSVKLVISSPEEKQEIDTGITVLIHNSSSTPNISTDVNEGKAPLLVHFDASKSEDPNGKIVDYIWDFGDPTSETNQAKGTQAIHTFAKTGTYEVKLVIVDENGEKRTTSKSIFVTDQESGIIPNIVASPLEGPAPLKVNFNASESKHTDPNRSLMTYEWDFGDSTAKIKSRDTSHIFREEGTFQVTLTIKDDQDNSKQQIVEIKVGDTKTAPEAKIITTPAILTGKPNFTVDFDGTLSKDEDGEVINYEWDFGDESANEVGPNASHTFSQIGQYTVVLTVLDNDNKKGTTSVVVIISEGEKAAPTAKITTTPSPAQGNVPLVITFDGSESKAESGDIISYLWNFGDSSSPVQTTAPTTSHKFEKVGIWPVTLTVTDSNGLTSKTEIKVAVNTEPPVAKFEASKTVGFAPVEIAFDAAESSGNITKYTWNFDDGTLDTGVVAKHTFKTKDTYTVRLTVEDAQGQVSIAEKTINVN